MMEITTKKALAKEVLILFLTGVSIVVFWGLVSLRNEYYSYGISNHKAKISSLNDSLHSLPTDYILRLYYRCRKTFIKKYTIDNGVILVSINDESEFLRKHANAVIIPGDPVGYASLDNNEYRIYKNDDWMDFEKNAKPYTGENVPEKVRALFDDKKPTIVTDPETIYELNSSQFAYYDISYYEFKTRVSGRPFDYEYHLPIRVDLDSVHNSIGYSSETKLEQARIGGRIDLLQQELDKLYSRLINAEDVPGYILAFSGIFIALAYPLRFIFMGVKWALKTLYLIK